jgi:MFS superfamily sulfate permease-like transporter
MDCNGLSIFTGFLVDLISTPVTSGFTTATAFIIVLSQVKGILGVKFKGDSVIDIIEKLIEHFHERRNGDIYLGLAAIVFILIMRVRIHYVVYSIYFYVKSGFDRYLVFYEDVNFSEKHQNF